MCKTYLSPDISPTQPVLKFRNVPPLAQIALETRIIARPVLAKITSTKIPAIQLAHPGFTPMLV